VSCDVAVQRCRLWRSSSAVHTTRAENRLWVQTLRWRQTTYNNGSSETDWMSWLSHSSLVSLHHFTNTSTTVRCWVQILGWRHTTCNKESSKTDRGSPCVVLLMDEVHRWIKQRRVIVSSFVKLTGSFITRQLVPWRHKYLNDCSMLSSNTPLTTHHVQQWLRSFSKSRSI